jgi:hypothetical protein
VVVYSNQFAMTSNPAVPASEEPNIEKATDGLHYETVDVPGVTTLTDVVYTDLEVKRLVRRLDFWILPILMISYGLQ